ncbi:hypothetical protein DBV15_10482 [Temnothorax longispinosus]|uniref:Uncharacterized protein n=1 Tax=Temnothorax longispinosus TaxID=300112 RepID=A0A4S2L7R9_9HYME|nr:hypothetical protein DBV15_10482 [Temnothorax longispinosus]
MTRALVGNAAKHRLYSGGWAGDATARRSILCGVWGENVFRTYGKGAQRVFTAGFRARGRAAQRRRIYSLTRELHSRKCLLATHSSGIICGSGTFLANDVNNSLRPLNQQLLHFAAKARSGSYGLRDARELCQKHILPAKQASYYLAIRGMSQVKLELSHDRDDEYAECASRRVITAGVVCQREPSCHATRRYYGPEGDLYFDRCDITIIALKVTVMTPVHFGPTIRMVLIFSFPMETPRARKIFSKRTETLGH